MSNQYPCQDPSGKCLTYINQFGDRVEYVRYGKGGDGWEALFMGELPKRRSFETEQGCKRWITSQRKSQSAWSHKYE